jgi:hypothetical protein
MFIRSPYCMSVSTTNFLWCPCPIKGKHAISPFQNLSFIMISCLLLFVFKVVVTPSEPWSTPCLHITNMFSTLRRFINFTKFRSLCNKKIFYVSFVQCRTPCCITTFCQLSNYYCTVHMWRQDSVPTITTGVILWASRFPRRWIQALLSPGNWQRIVWLISNKTESKLERISTKPQGLTYHKVLI